MSVVPDDVAALGRYIYGAAAGLRSALKSAGTEAEALTKESWSGGAATAFEHGWEECRDGGGQVIDALTSMAAKLGVTAANFQEHDARTAGNISSLDLP